MEPVLYLDYAAATPLDRRVSEAMFSCLHSNYFANPSAPHRLGKAAHELVETHRHYVSDLIGAGSNEVIWTSGATESNNLAIIGAALASRHLGNHVITVKTEHDSVLKTSDYLQTLGFTVTYLYPRQDGMIDLDELRTCITRQTILISTMFVNNETGVIQDIAKIAEIAKESGIIFHVDAAQAVGKLPMDVKSIGMDLMSISAHKMYGPKGIGALYINNQAHLEIKPILHGGLQEKGIRPGTLPSHQIVGFGEACRIAKAEMDKDLSHVKRLRDQFFDMMQEYVIANLPIEKTSPYIFNIFIPHLGREERRALDSSETLMLSSRSSCSNHKEIISSHVLEALGMTQEMMQNSYRISIGRFTTEKEILLATLALKRIIRNGKESESKASKKVHKKERAVYAQLQSRE